MSESVRVFEIARGDGVNLSVALPSAWALEHERVQVVFEEWDVCGWHATVPDRHIASRFERAVEHYESRVGQTSTVGAMLDELARLAASDPGDRE